MNNAGLLDEGTVTRVHMGPVRLSSEIPWSFQPFVSALCYAGPTTLHGLF